MAGEAAARGWALVTDTDLVRNLPTELGVLADDIAQDLGEPLVTSASGVTPSAGWTIGAGNVNGFKVGRLAVLTINATRTGAAIGPAGAAGNLADTAVATLSGTWAPDAAILPVPVFWLGGAYSGAGLLSAAGVVTVTDAHPTASIATGDVIRVRLLYRLAA